MNQHSTAIDTSRLPEHVARMQREWRSVFESGALAERHEQILDLYRDVRIIIGSDAIRAAEVIGYAESLEKILRPYLTTDRGFDRADEAKVQFGLEKLFELSRGIAPVEETELVSVTQHLATEDKPLVYVVEEDKELLAEICTQVEHFGYEAAGFSTTRLFEQRMQERPAQVVVMEVMFHDDLHAGVQSLKRMRARFGTAFELICLSAVDDFKYRLEAGRHGAEAFFVKPVCVFRLVEAVERLTTQSQTDPIRVLIVDDDRRSGHYLQNILKSGGMIVQTIDDPSAVLKYLELFMPDLILSELSMPLCTGQEMAVVIRQIETYAAVPIIYLATRQEIVEHKNNVKKGSDDFLVKPVNPDHLIDAIRLRAERFTALRRLMNKDSLTGLLNHDAVLEHFDAELSYARRQGHPICFAMIDVDLLQDVNDRYGRPAGDRVLRVLARLLMQKLRKSDMIGRYRGGSFAVVLRDTRSQIAREVLDKIRARFHKIHFTVGEDTFYKSFSCGIASDEGEVPPRMIKRAETALALAKADGRNVTVVG